jgi:ATP-dependent helicase/nuclease subunit B
VQRGLSVLTRARKPLATWLQTLLHSLAEIGVIEGWRADSAGSQVIVFIEKIQKELQGNALIVAFAEWRRWLTRQLESASFVESEVASPVVFTHLAATPLRDFDAALVLGCDARHLGASTDAPVFFNQGVRAQLGLPTRRDEARDTEALLAQLISATPRVVLSWQTHAGAEENLLAPPIERLVALHRVVYGEYGDALVEGRLPALLAQSSLRCVDGGPAVSEAAAPAPSANAALIPDAISASGYQALVTCPYRFHVRYLLGLGEADEVEERIDKSGHGRHVHAILTAFHRAHPQAGTLDQAVAHAELEAISEQAYAASMARDPLARGWLMRWKALIPAYLEWQHAREAEGWRWQAGEAQRELMIKTPRARVIKLYGRLDRVDQHAQGASAVLDYKTRTAEALKKTLETPGEDVQLAVYSLLSQGAAAQYVTLDRDAVQTVALPGDAGEAGAAARERLARLVDALHDGHALPAQGAPNACEYCEMHGLCRRGHWSSPA